MKNLIKKISVLPASFYNRLVFCYRKPLYTTMPRINGRIYMISDRGAISFGRDVRINSSLKSNPIGGSTRTIIFAKSGAKIQIGSRVAISNSAIFAASSITIEDDVMIGGDCAIYDTDFHSTNYDERIKMVDGDVQILPVVIKKGAFVGGHSIILKGVTVGEKSIIAAGSVVTKDIPANELWGGAPAVFIRKLVS